MKKARTLFELAKADYLERVRRFSFLVTLAVCLYAAYGFLPPLGANYVTLQMGMHRGVYNSAYVGMLLALLTATILALPGFYIVKNAVERDRQTRVGQILAATPLTKLEYTLGKWLSNWAVLATAVAVIAVSAGVMQLVRGESRTIELWPLLSPFLFLALPMMATVAAAAIVFENVPGLRGGAGNIAYFFLWGLVLSSGAAISGMGLVPVNEVSGAGIAFPLLLAACKQAFPAFDAAKDGVSLGIRILGEGEGRQTVTTFLWNGIHWTGQFVIWRLMWVGVAASMAGAVSILFDRFDPARWGARDAAKKGWLARWKERTEKRVFGGEEETLAQPSTAVTHLTPLEGAAGTPRLAPMISAELRVMLKAQSIWWWLVALGLIVATVFTPMEVARGRLLPILWIWPALIWSQLGMREKWNGVDQILYSAPHPVGKQLLAMWLAGAGVAVLTGAGVGARLLLGGDLPGFGAWCVGAMFIPALALAMGVWSGSSRLFEGVYVFYWYIGPMQPVPALDFMSASATTVAQGVPLAYAAATAALIVLAMAGRKRELSR